MFTEYSSKLINVSRFLFETKYSTILIIIIFVHRRDEDKMMKYDVTTFSFQLGHFKYHLTRLKAQIYLSLFYKPFHRNRVLH